MCSIVRIIYRAYLINRFRVKVYGNQGYGHVVSAINQSSPDLHFCENNSSFFHPSISCLFSTLAADTSKLAAKPKVYKTNEAASSAFHLQCHPYRKNVSPKVPQRMTAK